ncbi:MAG TPA: TIM44-like domain-containing protein [Oligoflexus sp.]|uniref:Tim44 domain-containing protein n=1 Tax=Oligoflexus sp. TaxID=1971216 RepID=UPI002D7F1620|nr:TIM44-like domain-containing protein [Oligoflexus sp.]HET9235625.1 TIM44-like domain-containing protein [Oligoflexus sp.]
MLLKKMGLMIRALLIVFSFSLLSMGEDAEARAGGKRSFGQRSQPTAQPRSPNPPPAQQQMQPPSNRGSFMKGLAGGLAGGLIGSMLFSSMAQGAGLGGAGGGIGLFDIILIAGLLYLAYRFWKNRQNQNRPAFAGGAPSMGYSPPMDAASATMARSSANYGSGSSGAGYFGQGSSASPYMASGPRLDRETVEDIFFRVQGAWTRRDLTPVQDYVERDVARVLDADLQDLKDRREINRLENISVRNLEFSEPWYEGDRELVRVRFTASLLDYTVDESTGALKSGSNTEPVKFDEYWIFAKSQGRSSWQLAGIEQI